MPYQSNAQNSRDLSSAAVWREVRRWAVRRGVSNKLTVAVLVLAILSGIATYIALTVTASPFNKNSWTVLWLLTFNIVTLIILAGMIARRVMTLWTGQRRGLAGAKLHVQLVRAFSFMAIIPSVIMAVFAAAAFSTIVDQWFGDRVSIAVNESLAVAQAYLEEHQQNIRADALSMAIDLNREAGRARTEPGRLSELLRTQSLVRNLSEAMVFTRRGAILARSDMTFSMEFESVPIYALNQVDRGEIVLQIKGKGDRVRALVKLDSYPDAYLFVGRLVEEKVLDHIKTAQRASADYTALQGKRSQVQLIFAGTFAAVALLLTLVAVWFGLWFANRLVAPISRLIIATEKVRAGDLSYRVQEINPLDELATLQRAFNRMTSQLETQRDDLMQANQMLDQRRIFTEAVLAGVPVGVLAIDEEGVITAANQVAEDMLGTIRNKHLADISFEMEELRRKLLNSEQSLMQLELQWGASNEMNSAAKTFLMRATRDSMTSQQVIVTLDDITVLQSAQRKAAWSDVARRVAHEIKNPLTPIQLSAERLKRKYLKQITDDPETFEACIDTIVRQVGDIESMVTEFSSFTRMPEAHRQKEDLGLLCKQAVFLQQQARGDIQFVLSLPDEPVFVWCDRKQMNQVLTNLLQNAIDAIDGCESHDEKGRITVSVEKINSKCLLIVQDNGKGLPENTARLTEPYVTTRAKGTGLGLAIVKKILDDHEAILEMKNNGNGSGARIEITLPISYNA